MLTDKFAFHTLGCKLNFAESSTIGRGLKDLGWEKVDYKEKASVYIINSCSVTENADKECAYWVRKAKRTNPESKVVVIGCYAQLKPEKISEINGVDCVLGANEKFNVKKWLSEVMEDSNSIISSCEIDDVVNFHSAYSLGERTRAFLKVQDGCDYSCTFCTIPLARGKSRSDIISNVIKQAESLTDKGIREIVLTGINLGDFGRNENNNETFFDLLLALNELECLDRIRISSIEPNLLDDRIIELMERSTKIVPHFHIPLQSGSDKVLKKMKRRYLRHLYTQKVSYIKNLMPHCSIGVDVIVGFPGETNGDFLETYNYLKDLPVSYFHVFTYSERNNTEAVEMEEVVPLNIRKERSAMLRSLSLKKTRSFYQSCIGMKRKVLFESKNKEGMLEGWTDNYIKVATPYNEGLINKIIPVGLIDIDESGRLKVELN